MTRVWVAALVVASGALAACSSAAPTGSVVSPRDHMTAPAPRVQPTAVPTPLPAYAIEALRVRPRVGSNLVLGATLSRGYGFTKRAITWTSMGSAMTGVLDIPDGPGPFPVVIVNHGYIPEMQYYVGQDSSKYADPMASAGLLTVSPN